SVYDLISQGDITYRTNLLTQSQQQAFLWISSTNPSNILKAGVYKVESGYQSFCPQNIEPKISNGKLTSLAVTYLSPCSGTYHTYSCQENKCSYSSSVYIIIQSMDHYAFSSSGNNAVFKFDHNSLGTDIGTVEASATERLDH
ncbi:MAG: hypothetical protein NTV34_00360, partial [Proteobacteria bacterium]|nr:hypothetical protein [Pseudomonadota bacterium]